VQDGGVDDDCKNVIQETAKAFGGLDIIISNAVREFDAS